MAESRANDTIRMLHERASLRTFSDRPIPDEVMDAVLGAGIHSATGGNLQPYSIIRIQAPEVRRKLAEMCHQAFIADAPVSLLFCIDWRRLERWAALETAPFAARGSFRHFWISFQDTVIAAQSICTAVDSFGMGSVYIGTIMEFFAECRDMFELPAGVLPVVLLCLGYPRKELAKPRAKLGVEVVVHEERYREIRDDELRAAFDAKYAMKPKISDRALSEIEAVCREVRGDEFAARCLERIRAAGFINMAQYYFGLHYQANEMAKGNQDFVKRIGEAGFNWFGPPRFEGRV
ncbi:nitroreductase family protein [bacterium]|nr:nitroreductase family protein [candidate division CSSED10-310 bacterium]